MSFSGSTQRFREAREAERERRREEARQQAKLASRADEQREGERQEARRQEAVQAYQELQAGLDAARERREALLASLRAGKRAERRDRERLDVRRERWLARVRGERVEATRAEAEADAKRIAERQQLTDARRAERQEAERKEGARHDTRHERQQERRGAEPRNERSEARRATSRAEERSATRGEERRSAAEPARVAERRKTERDAIERASEHHAEPSERQTAAAEAEKRDQSRARAREARRKARREEDKTEERQAAAHEARRSAQRDAARAEIRDEAMRTARRGQARGAEQAEVGRAAAQEAGREARQALREVVEAPPRERPSPVRDPLQDRIPSGTLSGSLPWLQVRAHRLVTVAGDAIILRGLSLLGLDSIPPDPDRGFAAGAGMTEEMLNAALDWGATVLRLAINRDRVLAGSAGWSPWDYLSDLDGIIRHAANRGAYSLLSLRRLDEGSVFGTTADGTANFIAPQPDYDTIGMWRLLGERYADEPAVLFDLYAAPHAALADDLSGFDTDWSRWTLWVQMMVAELRRVHPRAVCFVCGPDWGTDVSGFPVIGTGGDPIPNLVYAVHLVPTRRNPWTTAQALARRHPVFVTEWQGDEAHVTWGEQMAMTLGAAGVGWTAAHWSGDTPLVRTVGRQRVPTSFGTVVRRALTTAALPRIAAPPDLLAGLSV